MQDDISELKRKLAELQANQSVAQAPSKPKPGGVPALRRMIALVVLAIIVIAALSNSRHTTPGVSTLKAEDSSAPKREMSDAEVQAKWNAMWGAFSGGFKRGFVEGTGK